MFSRTKSVGRFARSVEIITQRPTIGSFLSSGNYRILSALSKLHILRRHGSIAKYFDLRAGAETIIVYAYNIDSPLTRWWKAPTVLSCDLRQFPAFVIVHRGFRSFHVARCPCLNFNKTKYIRLPSDQIDFSPAPRGAKIPRHDLIPQPAQMEVCGFLTPRTGTLVTRSRIRGKQACQPIQSSNDRLRDLCGKQIHTPNIMAKYFEEM